MAPRSSCEPSVKVNSNSDLNQRNPPMDNTAKNTDFGGDHAPKLTITSEQRDELVAIMSAPPRRLSRRSAATKAWRAR